MTDEVLLEKQVTYLYDASAKGLYNLALYSVRDRALAEQLAADAFAAAYFRLSDKSDAARFRIKSAGQLYRIIKRTLIKHSRQDSRVPHMQEGAVLTGDEENPRVNLLLSRLDYDERFLLLLILQQRFSSRQAAQILRIPKFIVKRRIYRILKEITYIWAYAVSAAGEKDC